jgi:hypothetical protein
MTDPFSIAAGVIAVLQLLQSIRIFVYDLTGRPELCRRLLCEVACIEGLMNQARELERALGSQDEWQTKVSLLQNLLQELQIALHDLDDRLKKVRGPRPQAAALWPIHEKAIAVTLETIER